MKNKVAVITGASRGIGAATAGRFAAGGFNLALSCRAGIDDLEALAQDLETRFGVTCLTFQGDMGLSPDVDSFFQKIRESLGTPSVLVNNAGISRFGLIAGTSLSDWNEIMRVNATSVFLCTKAVLPMMLHEKSGSIINVSSVWGGAGASCEAAYSASKGAVDAFTRAAAKELAPSGISVNAVAPGCIDTDMNAYLSAAERAGLEEEIPAGRFGLPSEAASLIYDIALQSPYLTGQIIKLDGGWI